MTVFFLKSRKRQKYSFALTMQIMALLLSVKTLFLGDIYISQHCLTSDIGQTFLSLRYALDQSAFRA